jgi:hypothetical protein
MVGRLADVVSCSHSWLRSAVQVSEQLQDFQGFFLWGPVTGDFWGTVLLVPFQVMLFVGVPITYSVTGGQSLHKVSPLATRS